MELDVYWTHFAEDKLADIYNYYKLKAGKQVAQKLINGIIDITIDLGKHLRIGQKEPLLMDRQQEFRYLIFKNYKILYLLNQSCDRIEIVNVFDCRQNPEKINESENPPDNQ